MASGFLYRRRVEFADTDTANLIHFTALMRYMEEAEHAFYRSLGFHGYRWSETSVFGMPRVSVSCEYLGAIRYGDVVQVKLELREVRSKALRFAAEFTLVAGDGAAPGPEASEGSGDRGACRLEPGEESGGRGARRLEPDEGPGDGETDLAPGNVVARADWTVVCARRDHGSRDWRAVPIPSILRRQLTPGPEG